MCCLSKMILFIFRLSFCWNSSQLAFIVIELVTIVTYVWYKIHKFSFELVKVSRMLMFWICFGWLKAFDGAQSLFNLTFNEWLVGMAFTQFLHFFKPIHALLYLMQHWKNKADQGHLFSQFRSTMKFQIYSNHRCIEITFIDGIDFIFVVVVCLHWYFL